MLSKKEFDLNKEWQLPGSPFKPADLLHVSFLLKQPQHMEIYERFRAGKLSRSDIKLIVKENKRISAAAKAKGDTAIENNARNVAEHLEALLKGYNYG